MKRVLKSWGENLGISLLWSVIECYDLEAVVVVLYNVGVITFLNLFVTISVYRDKYLNVGVMKYVAVCESKIQNTVISHV